ncbi:hypothetical protein [Rhizobium sp.]
MATCMCGPGGDWERVEGTSGKDRLFGRAGDDLVNGFSGDDKLYGGSGKDMLVGGQGNDLLRGDKPGKSKFADTFVFGKNSGKDIITDFDVGKDVLQIFKGINGIRKASDVLDHAKQKGKNVVIDLGDGNKITLKNTDLDDLKKNPSDHFDVTKNLTF